MEKMEEDYEDISILIRRSKRSETE